VSFHRHPDAFVEENSVCHVTPIDELEPIVSESDQVREARLRALSVLNNALAVIGEALSRPNATVHDVARAYWQVCLALGLPLCQGQSFTAIALRLNCKRATISKGSVQFCEANGLPSSPYMKIETSRQVYADARIASVASNGNGANGTTQ